jgi:hypothetical protein
MVLWKTPKVAALKGVTSQTVRKAILRGELEAVECVTVGPDGFEYVSEHVVRPDAARSWTPKRQGRPRGS